MADLIVLAGCAAIENASQEGLDVPFIPGRMDAESEGTDAESFAYLEPKADGFRNYYDKNRKMKPEEMLLDRASLLGLSAPEMTVLVGGMRSLGATVCETNDASLVGSPGKLTNEFFVNLLNTMEWKTTGEEGVFTNGKVRASQVDLWFGSHSELRAIAEYYASEQEAFVRDFVKAWTKVMNADRYDLGSNL